MTVDLAARGVTRNGASLRLDLSQLRKKLEVDPANPVHLLPESGVGYRFSP